MCKNNHNVNGCTAIAGHPAPNQPGLGLGGIFDIMGSGTQVFKESGPEMEIPDRYLHFGGNVVAA